MKTTGYRRLRLLGEGGQGRVFLAEEEKTGRKVALKFPATASNQQMRAFLKAEVALLSRLSHPNLVALFDYRGDADEPFYAMEFVDGVSIDRALRAASPERAIALFVSLCRGLHHLHARGFLHGDLKPSNVLVAAGGDVKLLDFGLGGVATPLYAAPETFSGSRGPESDLFSLGKIFAEAGRQDFPDYFRELLDRLTQTDPAKRPHSALSLIKYLNHHVPKPFEIGPEETTLVTLQKPPWVARKEEDIFGKWIDAARKMGGPALLRLTGPTGVGRSRFLEEMTWKRKLASHTADWTAFEDLQERDEFFLNDLALRLRRERTKAGAIFLLEYADDRVSPALSRLLAETEDWETSQTLVLADLNPAQARRLIDLATAESPLAPERREALAEASGGRPLLIVESLRRPDAAVSADLAEAVRSRTASLTKAERELLGAVVAHPEPAAAEDASFVSGLAEKDAQDARLSLQAVGYLAAPDATRPHLRLAHPSLRELYRKNLPPDRLRDLHGRWTKRLIDGQGGKVAATPAAALIANHALAAENADALKAWGAAAVESLMGSGRLESALKLCDGLLAFPKFAGDPVQEYTWHAHRAPLLSRLGRYDEAVASYDRWHALKPDDGTGVEDVKHRLYTGMVLYAAGRREDAEKRFRECLAAGDSEKYAHHRPYHARAHFLLGSRADLEEAAKLAQGHPLLLGEIENQRGLLKQAEGRRKEAFGLFRSAAGHYREAKNAHAEAIAIHSIGMLLREDGHPDKALEAMSEAVRLAEGAGEPAQILRYRLNRGLVFLDLGRYREALQTYESVRDAVDPASPEGEFSQNFGRELNLLTGVREDARELDASLVAKASRFAAAHAVVDFLKFLTARPGEDAAADRLQDALAAVKAMPSPEARAELYGRLAEGLKREGFERLSRTLRLGRLKELRDIQRSLPEDLKMDFEKKRGLSALEESLKDLAGLSPAGPPPAAAASPGQIPEARFRQFCEINKQIALKSGLNDILERVIDAAIEMTGAERGFLLLKDDAAAKGAFPGYEVKTARRLNQETLREEEFQFSLTAVKETLKKGSHILTDDAQLDPRFQEKKSVTAYGLKSMLVVPLEADGKIFGAVYLDHRYRPGCFSAQDVALLDAFAVQASLAIQKARLVQSLKAQVQSQKEEIETLTDELARSRDQLKYGYEEIVGRSPPMMKVFEVLDHVTETAIPVWIHGESGTGKELVARSLHHNSARKDGPFVAENVSTIPETLLESELFGHKKGAFTHADRDRAGLFEQADGGTLFLDEVADMSLAMQAKLLRVLQDGEVRPVGSSKKVKVDVRLVSASNRDLNDLAAAGKFRQDLLFRINGLTIQLPPLRDRKEDIPLLAAHLVRKISRESGLSASEIADDALELLLKRDWPGNIRELESKLRNALLFAKGRPITRKLLASQEAVFGGAETKSAVPARKREEDLAERRMIIEALRRHGLDKEKAAEELGISLRNLYTRMDRHGIPKKKTVLAQ
ncbi:MAG TPA: sigma 54-interacting transcriptional regulator, partial [bacterium]|nr:sigma 54-interacting transcriptional regulator [bacterium]